MQRTCDRKAGVLFAQINNNNCQAVTKKGTLVGGRASMKYIRAIAEKLEISLKMAIKKGPKIPFR